MHSSCTSIGGFQMQAARLPGIVSKGVLGLTTIFVHILRYSFVYWHFTVCRRVAIIIEL